MATTTTTTTTTTATIANNTSISDGRKPLVKDLHEHIVCPLCRGYLIDATTLVECLHSFCRGCIVRRLGSGARACPVCGALTLPPLLPDLALQRLVYLAVPGLYRSELERRRHFRLVNPQCPPPAPPVGALSLTLEDAVSLSLCEILNDEDIRDEESTGVTLAKKKNRHHHRRQDDEEGEDDSSSKRLIRYLKCPAGVTVRHLVRLLALKRGWGDTDGKFTLKNIEMLYRDVSNSNSNSENDNDDEEYAAKNDRMHKLQLSWTLLDLACIFKWDKEKPMRLFYRVVKREEPILQPPSISSYAIGCNGVVTGNANVMENVQRPPTPPPSPKQSNSDLSTQPQSKPRSKPGPDDPGPEIAVENPEKSGEPDSPIESERSWNAQPRSNQEPANPEGHRDTSGNAEIHGVKIKKPRCEVTPVMRAPGFFSAGNGGTENLRSGKVPRMEHHKRRKRRNKRLIAEITTTPREDLLKLKVRLTPCPPRITSSTGSNAKEKLLQMRAVRREKIKSNNESNQVPPPPTPGAPAVPTVVTNIDVNVNSDDSPEMPLTPPPSASAENVDIMPVLVVGKTDENIPKTPKIPKTKENLGPGEREETIEDIIDGIPDEVVRVAQNMNSGQTSSGPNDEKIKIKKVVQELQNKKEKTFNGNQKKKKKKKKKRRKQQQQQQQRVPEVEIISDEDEDDEEDEEDEQEQEEQEEEEEEEEEEEAGEEQQRRKLLNDKPKKDEEVLRRLGLVAISEASKTLQDKIRGSQNSGCGSGGGIDLNRETLERQLRESKANRVRSLLAEKQMRDALKSIMSKSKTCKGPTNGGPKKGPPPLAPLTPKQGFPVPPKSSHHPQIVPRGSPASGKIETPLDLSSGANNALDLSPATPSSGVNPPVITSTTFSSPVPKSRGKSTGGGIGKLVEEKKNQDLNLRTLSDAAVSLLGTTVAPTTGEVRITNSAILSNKVALRIPQPHNRITGFGNGMKIKPNLAVRHIPNPQAFVASQYVRNQRTNFFNAQQQQQPP